MGFLDSDMPNYGPVQAPMAGTDQVLANIGKRAVEESPAAIKDQLRAGTDTSSYIDRGEDNGLYSALSSKYSAPYRFQQEQQDNSANWTARQQKFQANIQAAGLLQREKQINDQIALMQKEAEKEKQRARARIVGQLIGVGTMIGGAALTAASFGAATPIGVGMMAGGAAMASKS